MVRFSGSRNTGQTSTVAKMLNTDAGDTIRNCDARQFIALVEGPSPDAGDTIRNCDASSANGTVTEGSLPNAGDAVRDRDAGQGGAVFEGKISDAGDAIRDRDACQVAFAFIERHNPRCW